MRILTLVLFALLSNTCWAALGGAENTVEIDRRSLAATAKSSQTAGYTVHTLSLPGETVNEYVNKAGMVFAVVWSGIRTPDLSVLLGTNYSKYQDALAKAPKLPGHRFVAIRNSDLIFLNGGHMRAFHGRAIVPAQVPTGVNAETLP